MRAYELVSKIGIEWLNWKVFHIVKHALCTCIAFLLLMGGLGAQSTTVNLNSNLLTSAQQPTSLISISSQVSSSSTVDLSLNQGVPWNNSTLITTGSGYDIRSGRMIRRVLDFTVAGSVGEQPLHQMRVATCDAQSRVKTPIAETVWSMTPYDYRVLGSSSSSFASVMYPDGTSVSFGTVSNDGGATTLTQGHFE